MCKIVGQSEGSSIVRLKECRIVGQYGCRTWWGNAIFMPIIRVLRGSQGVRGWCFYGAYHLKNFCSKFSMEEIGLGAPVWLSERTLILPGRVG